MDLHFLNFKMLSACKKTPSYAKMNSKIFSKCQRILDANAWKGHNESNVYTALCTTPTATIRSNTISKLISKYLKLAKKLQRSLMNNFWKGHVPPPLGTCFRFHVNHYRLNAYLVHKLSAQAWEPTFFYS